MQNTSPTGPVDLSWEKELNMLGFSCRRGGSRYTRNGVSFSVERNWPVLKAEPDRAHGDPLAEQMGRPGLWKFVTEGDSSFRIFELPLSIVIADARDFQVHSEDQVSTLGSLLTWGIETVGHVHRKWHSPRREDLTSLVPRGGLTAVYGPHARQGELICDPERMALRFPILHKVPQGLSAQRQYWLRRLLMEAQNTWRMVRVGFVDGLGGLSVLAEIDLTGAPQTVLPELIKVSVAALQCVVKWLLAPAVIIVDAQTSTRALEIPAFRPSGDKSLIERR